MPTTGCRPIFNDFQFFKIVLVFHPGGGEPWRIAIPYIWHYPLSFIFI